MITDLIFDLVSYEVDRKPHIEVNREVCRSCTHRACTFVCPVRCYEWNDAMGRIDFSYEACLECGTCLIVCEKGALDWSYPRGGFGVRYRET
jgi:ferredoxin like protein